MTVSRSAPIPSVSITIPESRVAPPESLSIQATHSTSESPNTCHCASKAVKITLISGGVGLFVGTIVAGLMETFAQDPNEVNKNVISLSSSIAALGSAAITGSILSRLCCYTSPTAEDDESVSGQEETESRFSSSPPSYEEIVRSDHSSASGIDSDYLPSYDEVVDLNKVPN